MILLVRAVSQIERKWDIWPDYNHFRTLAPPLFLWRFISLFWWKIFLASTLVFLSNPKAIICFIPNFYPGPTKFESICNCICVCVCICICISAWTCVSIFILSLVSLSRGVSTVRRAAGKFGRPVREFLGREILEVCYNPREHLRAGDDFAAGRSSAARLRQPPVVASRRPPLWDSRAWDTTAAAAAVNNFAAAEQFCCSVQLGRQGVIIEKYWGVTWGWWLGDHWGCWGRMCFGGRHATSISFPLTRWTTTRWQSSPRSNIDTKWQIFWPGDNICWEQIFTQIKYSKHKLT